jgi:hypothetical protein
MRSRLLALTVMLALGLTGLVLVPATPAAAAEPAHCNQAQWNTHPDLYSGGGISFANGTAIRDAGYTDCSRNGLGYPTQGINVHCAEPNDNGLLWLYVVDTTTGVAGWAREDALTITGSHSIADCRN